MGDTILYGDNLSIAAFIQQPTHWKKSVLGVLCFSKASGFSTVTGEDLMLTSDTVLGKAIPCLQVPMPRLDDADSSCETWQGCGNLTQGKSGDINYQFDGEVLFGVIQLSETTFETSADKTLLQQASESAYRQIFALADEMNFPHLFRFWNYMSDINGQSDGLERYLQFNLGRQDAFLANDRSVEGNVPAACALGFKQNLVPAFSQDSLSIAFLAGRVMPIAIENPRQISAFLYPQQYGPRSPTFARAALVQLRQSEVLFISGTASIVGHATLHTEDVVVQTRETMINIEAVLAEANRVAHQPKFCLTDLHYRVYVRHSTDFAQIQAELTRYVGSSPKAVYLQADICRQKLLLEIEATVEYPLPPPSVQD
ncbi:MAG: Rid family hydrolase [Methylophilaceae bacterium]